MISMVAGKSQASGGVAEGARLVIVGAGGFGREVLDIVVACNLQSEKYEFLGFLDDGFVRLDLLERRRVSLLGTSVVLAGISASYVIGIGDGAVRASLAERFGDVPAATLVHPSATVGGDVRVSPGVIIAAGARVTTNIDLHEHVHLHVNCTVGHDTVMGPFASVFPGATVSGNVVVGRGATIGTGANVLPGVTIGDGAFVGAGAVVTQDVASRVIVVGSPARPLNR